MQKTPQVHLVMLKIIFHTSNLKRNAGLQFKYWLAAYATPLPECFRKTTTNLFTTGEHKDRLLIDGSGKTGSPVIQKCYDKLLQTFHRACAIPVNTIYFETAAMFQSCLSVYELVLYAILPKIDQLTVRQVGQHQVLNKLTLVRRSQRSNGFQFERAPTINDEIYVQFFTKPPVLQADLKLLNRSATKNMLQSGPIGRFVKNSPQFVVDLKSMLNQLVGNLPKICLRKALKWNGRRYWHTSKSGRKMWGQKNEIIQNSFAQSFCPTIFLSPFHLLLAFVQAEKCEGRKMKPYKTRSPYVFAQPFFVPVSPAACIRAGRKM